MRIWAIADLHLSFGVPNKEMGVFGENWKDHFAKIEEHWRAVVQPEDLVLIAGDISWALHLEEVIPDLQWIDRLPGTKVLSKGNHDLWWKSIGQLKKILPPSLHVIHNSAFSWHGIAIGGTRMWDCPGVDFSNYIIFRKAPEGIHIHQKEISEEALKHDEKIYQNELSRLATSLSLLDSTAKHRIAMVHYPPTGPLHQETEVTTLLKEARIDTCIYGHVHNLRPEAPVNFTLNGIRYLCTAADYLHFKPVLLL